MGRDDRGQRPTLPWLPLSLAAVPLGLSALAAIGLWIADPGVRWRISAPATSIVLSLGVVLSGLALAAVIAWWWMGRARAQGVRQAREAAHAEHGQFLARLDHELKNPLMAIRASLATARTETDEEADTALLRQLAVADGQADRMAVLVADLRKLADLRDRTLDREPVVLTELCDDAVEAVRDSLAATGGGERDWQVSFPTAPWQLSPVSGDPDLLYVAVHNVIANAAKFTRPGDTIEVRGLEEEGAVSIEVADTGTGIPEGETAMVFEELARASNARGTPGSGLGLPLVLAIVERHGGRCTVRSRLGKGTSVRLTLPLR